MAATQAVKLGQANDLMARVADDPAFATVKGDLATLLAPMRFVGRAPQQVDDYLTTTIDPLLQRREGLEPVDAEVHV
jgi:adenylosuccinate lyase